MEIPSLFHCTVLISCLLISSSRGPLCFIILLSGGVPAKFLPFASGCSCTLALPFCLLSTRCCFCMLMKGPAPPAPAAEQGARGHGEVLWVQVLMRSLHRRPLPPWRRCVAWPWAPQPLEGEASIGLGVCAHVPMCLYTQNVAHVDLIIFLTL